LAPDQLLNTEHPDLRVFALHPGVIETVLVGEAELSGLTFDTAALPAATALTISAGKAEWLRGRFGYWFNYVMELHANP
jgi:hypothetical protein